ncbi:DNA-binding proteins Bright/BRCAA1/RBP1 and proteins containing BRIGHT domain [Diaporthe eres]|uniref:DNA-binding proteins Bright/BRCAA1/RBP1 and proteins containing BRIGHT domain n=1 Tax=Diaporthe eres TaxID=83184 RepID=A0ABR1PHA5_DIAER
MASAARDIQATSGRDNLTAVAAQSVPVTRSHPLPLPTPPNSISPGLRPHGLRAQFLKAKLESDVPDLDLHAGQGDNSAQFDTGAHGVPGSAQHDPVGAITPALLAKHHLPDILLNHGPLAIRHITGYLTTSVPGFAGIPPAKARRLVVGALEGRGSGREGGGLDGDVVFEKVGWGRWDARRRGQARRDSQAMQDASSPFMSSPSLSGIPIAGGAAWSNERTRLAASSPEESLAFSHDDRGFYTHDNDADNMSMDGPASASCSEAPDDDDDDVVMNDDDPDDVTDEEDWAAIGAAGLRAQSYSRSAQAQPGTFPSRFHTTSSGMARAPQLNNIDFAALAATSDAQEREAIEALIRLGSV